MPVELQDCLCCCWYIRKLYKILIPQKAPDQFKMTLSTKWASTPTLVPQMVACALCHVMGLVLLLYNTSLPKGESLYLCQLTADNPCSNIFSFIYARLSYIKAYNILLIILKKIPFPWKSVSTLSSFGTLSKG